jgi:surface antigen
MRNLLKPIMASMVAALILGMVACKKTDEIATIAETTETVSPAAKGATAPNQTTACTSLSDACANTTNNGNCVYYARCKSTHCAPSGMTTYADKQGKCNLWTAKVGAVAVINTGSTYGHVAVVTAISGTTITLRESNWCGKYVSSRSGTASGLNIYGYIW